MILFLNRVKNVFRYGEFSPTSTRISLIQNYKIFTKKSNTIFIHIPKTAGNSLQMGLFGALSPGHVSVKDYMDYLGEKEYNSKFTFTIVRNPYDRLISSYNYIKSGGKSNRDLAYMKVVSKFKDFEDFVLNFFKQEEYMEIEHLIPQTYWLKDHSEKLNVKYIGKFEQLDVEFKHISEKIFPDKKLVLPKLNVTSNRFEQIYTKQMLEIVNEIYTDDFNSLGYMIIDK